VPISPKQFTRSVTRPAVRVGAAAQNALEIARFGGLQSSENEATAYDIVGDGPNHDLRRYVPDSSKPGTRPVVMLVPPLMLAAELYDVAPATSATRLLAGYGMDVYVVDFGAPEHIEGGLERTLADHVKAISLAVDQARQLTGRDVHLAGYSQGGMFCYQVAAYRKSEGIASVITFGSPVDTHERVPFGLPARRLTGAASKIVGAVVTDRSLPAWLSRTGFKLLDPVKAARGRIDFIRQLHDRELLLQRDGQRRFLEADGWVAWPGPAMAEFVDQFVAHNRMLSGGFQVDDVMVTLADITSPMLCFVGEVDEIAPPNTVRPVVRAAPRTTVWERTMNAGHFGLVVGSKAAAQTWPVVAEWVSAQDGRGDLPADVVPMRDLISDEDAEPSVHPGYGLRLAVDVGTGMARSLTRAARRSSRAFGDTFSGAVETLPRLVRLERVDPDTPISLGLLLDERAARDPDGTFLLYEGRGHTWGAAKRRVDNIVRGLISLGIRQGEHVGVLMSTRPSAVAVVAALNRLGAVTVLLRTDGSLERELELGRVTRLIVDPEHAALASGVADVPVLVLGGGGEPRELGFGLTDMERIDPDAVELPGWYRPNPGRASDLAFVLFTGRGERTRSNRITNRRWALSAFGTAAAAHLTSSDTVYGAAPLFHPAGLLTTVGGAIAGGSRLALATQFDPSTFWDEVRRYGVTIVSYTWTMCHDLVSAPDDPAERHHSIRLFVGAGMPISTWRRLRHRFAPAGVLELYASTEGRAVLANLAGAKLGAKGRPLPGSAEVAVVQWDIEANRLVLGEDGLGRRCAPGQVGMLLSGVDRASLMPASPLRGVLKPGDRWLATGDLFRVDEDGDHWFLGSALSAIRSERGPVPHAAVSDALCRVEAVALAVAYGLPAADGTQLVAVTVTLRDERELDPGTVQAVLELELPDAWLPDVIRVVDELPRTTWYRIDTAAVAAQGLGTQDRFLVRSARGRTYRWGRGQDRERLAG